MQWLSRALSQEIKRKPIPRLRIPVAAAIENLRQYNSLRG
jgi:hypothetical protein